MSTRSGRRIHGSFHEPEVQVDVETTSKSVKKTRNKRLKDNKEVLETTVPTVSKSKKRNNYVSYPSDEEALGVCEVPKETKEEPSRGIRKNALKEQNLNISNVESVDIVIEKPVRLTRRTKRFVEDDSDQNAEKEVLNTVTLEDKKSKKNKKKKSKKEVVNENEVVARKSKRKKKSNQDHENDKSSALNGSNMSVESFHSAAGSPIHVGVNNILNSTFEKSPEEVQEIVKNTVLTNDRKRRSIHNSNDIIDNLNISVSKTNSPKNKRVSRQNSTFEITDIETTATATKSITPNKRLTRRNSTLNITQVETVTNSTFEKEKRRSSIKNGTFNADTSITNKPDINTTFDKNKSGTPSKLNATFEKEARRRSLRQSSTAPAAINSTYEKEQSEVLNSTFDKETKLNSTFDKEKDKPSSNKSSLVTSDDTCNLTFDKSDERISITSDDSRIENTTPVLIESSLDESHINTSGGKKQSPKVSTPNLKREGTFTKDGPEVESKSSMESIKTPTKRMSIATPGSTPFPFSKSGQKERALLNVTRSIEKSRLSVDHVDPAPRMTRVMFCSPVNNPVVVAQQKRKVIKSNLKGSNKSFVFEESAPARAVPRKRSYTHNDAEDARAHVKRTRLNDDMQTSVDRLSRPRTSSTKPAEPTTPSKRIPTPSKSKSESKVSRTKLPNFAALHQRRFEKMESLDECQLRKAKRAKQLLTPSAPVNVLERSSPRVSDEGTVKEVKKPEPRIEPKTTRSKDEKKIEIKKKEECTKEKKKEVKNSEDVNKSQLTLDSLKRGYTRFGFKMNVGVNPFSVPRTEVKVKEVNGGPKADGKIKGKETKNGLTRQVSQPSLAGTTLNRKEAAKQLVMREKSVTRDRRDLDRKVARTVIRGVRTNRRFELQMQMRNIS